MREIRLDHPHNEASALVAIHDRKLLESRGWEAAFWIVSDEKPAGEAIAALGRAGNDWTLTPLTTKLHGRTSGKPAEDCETIARAGAWIYVLGSQYGSKKGILEAKRHFVARFNEALVTTDGDALHADLELARVPFLLHRLVNDALRERGIALIARDDTFIEETRALAKSKKKAWRKRVEAEDHPINVEGAAFLPNGHLLLGLRYPVTAEGQPILIEVERIDQLFEGGEPHVASVWIIENAGSAKKPEGVRELDARGAAIHVITGELDHPGARPGAANAHLLIAVPKRRRRTLEKLAAERLRTFRRGSNVEGVAVQDDGTVWYVHDDEQIRLGVARI